MKNVLVCVTAQQSSTELVKTGKVLAEKYGASLEVLCVLPLEQDENRTDPQVVDRIYTATKAQGGDMAIYFSDDPILTAVAHIAKRKPITIVTGFPGEESNDFISTVHLLLPKLNITMAEKDGTTYNIIPCEVNTGKTA